MAALRDFMEYYNHDRPHRSLALATPVPSNPYEGWAGHIARRSEWAATRL